MTKEQIYGRRVWNLLHSTAAYFPETPSEEEKQHARQFINYFMSDGIEYADWGTEFNKSSKSEVDVSNRENFSKWVCIRHNVVNAKLGKPEFPCDYASLKKRWGPPWLKQQVNNTLFIKITNH